MKTRKNPGKVVTNKKVNFKIGVWGIVGDKEECRAFARAMKDRQTKSTKN